MFLIQDLLKKYGNILETDSYKREEFSKIIKDYSKITVLSEQIFFFRDVVFLKIGNLAKNEILLKSEKIISEAVSKFGKNFPQKII